MNTASERREHFAQRTTDMRDLIARMDDLDEATVLSSVDPILRERLALGRVLPRLVMRRARRIAPNGLFTPPSDSREKMLLQGGSVLVETLCHSAGVHILWHEVVRLVRRIDAHSLDKDLGIASREIALTAREEAIGVVPLSPTEEEMSLSEKAKQEGALSWACWLAACKPDVARRLRVLTPDSVASRVHGGLPDNPEQRNLRRRVVEFEIDRIMARATAETEEKQVL